ncbi:MAG: DNA repair exonuclease [Planctomycetota bacterium]
MSEKNQGQPEQPEARPEPPSAPAKQPLRLVHASDFHLEDTLGGVAEVPDHLREVFLTAPFLAAEQVFELAIAEGADALLLSGDIANLELAGPRAVAFLTEQFDRLNDHNIGVYWAGGVADPPGSWPPSTALPENVHRFPASGVEDFVLERRGERLARIQGVSRVPGKALDDSGFHRDAGGLFTVGVAHGSAASPGSEGDRLHYAALGGQHQRQTVDQSPGIAHYCGSPQGRSPAETGAHGCTLVVVDETGRVRTKLLPTDSARWLTGTVELTSAADESSLLKLINDQVSQFRQQHTRVDLLVTWRVLGTGPLVNRLRHGGLADELLRHLRREAGTSSPALWHADLVCEEPMAVPQEWRDQETILGDLLQEFGKFDVNEDLQLDLAEFLPPQHQQGEFAALAEVSTGADREALLRDASKLGLDLLTPDE